jgi:molybdopterin-biosynthesis enzyme MoeA-like protein
MKQITIKLPNEQLAFFKQLVEKLGFEIEQDVIIPDSHKAIVRDRIEKSKPEDLVSWKEARKKLVFKK